METELRRAIQRDSKEIHVALAIGELTVRDCANAEETALTIGRLRRQTLGRLAAANVREVCTEQGDVVQFAVGECEHEISFCDKSRDRRKYFLATMNQALEAAGVAQRLISLPSNRSAWAVAFVAEHLQSGRRCRCDSSSNVTLAEQWGGPKRLAAWLAFSVAARTPCRSALLGSDVLARTPSFRKKGKVSLWLGMNVPNQEAMEGVDVLKDLCGVDSYDLDNQELSAVDDDSFPRAAVSEILGMFSYSSSFIEEALERAEQETISHVHWALAQFDFAYDPRRVSRSVAVDPLFLGVFDWNDSEDDE